MKFVCYDRHSGKPLGVVRDRDAVGWTPCGDAVTEAALEGMTVDDGRLLRPKGEGYEAVPFGTDRLGRCDVLQIGGSGAPAAWYWDKVEYLRSQMKAAGLRFQNAFPEPHEINTDDLLKMIDKTHCRLVINRGMVIPAQTVAMLATLRPAVTFCTVCHSSLSFLPAESSGCVKLELFLALARSLPNCWFATPHQPTAVVLQTAGQCRRVVWWPNVIEMATGMPRPMVEGRSWRIALIGALRLQKNVPMQIAAVAFLAASGVDCELYLSWTRPDRETFVAQMESLVASFPRLKAAVVAWESAERYRRTLGHYDIGMQVSQTESENIVALDLMQQGIPVLGSTAIRYLPVELQCPGHDDPIAIAHGLGHLIEHYPRLSQDCLAAARTHIEANHAQFRLGLDAMMGGTSCQPTAESAS